MKRTDIKKIMLIGSGPIAIGQGCEFDYSGVQACKALRKEGYEVVLVNSNPATVMTDPAMADRTYIEPLTADILHEIIRRERPDALLPTLGGQTALNLAMELHDKGILRRLSVEMIGANAEAIRKAEDRKLFKEAMTALGLDVPRSGSAHTAAEAEAVASAIGTWPLVIRPGFTLGGTGGGIARNKEEFAEIVRRGLDASFNSEVLIEESLLGWKEFEMEVMRDSQGTAVIVCSIENLDPMGVHTGDSITVAPIQTLTDREYQEMRTDSLRVLEAIGIETGGSNVQWAVNPETGRRIIIEMNPRVSRSSALASKATGFPIAKIAALLAVGHTLDELRNDITRETPASFEPALDYVVVKVPRFTFEKFPKADPRLGTQMKSVGEAMAIGATFKESFQKALRSLETKHVGFGAEPKDAEWKALDDAELEGAVATPAAERVFAIHEALRRGWGVERIHALTKIDRYFLRHLEELAAFEDEIAAKETLAQFAADKPFMAQTKALGFSNAQIAHLLGADETDVMAAVPPCSFGAVDTCAGEFAAHTPYFYSTNAFDIGAGANGVADVSANGAADVSAGGAQAAGAGAGEPPRKPSVLVLGGGPNRIGQGIEFDYCCCHAVFALHAAGYETVMVNSNPETVSTDYDTADRLYFEPLTLEDVMNVYRRERCVGVIVQFGGQTPLNLAARLEKAGARILGTSVADIASAEDRDFFKALADKIGILQPASGIAHNVDEALAAVAKIGYPVLVRPSFVLGGRGMVIVHDEARLREFVGEAAEISPGKPILIDRFLEDAMELDVDLISDGETSVVGAIMEHVEPAGIHSGDSACMIPPQHIAPDLIERIHAYAYRFAEELHVVGLMNMQLAIKGREIYMIEVNPRASRTVPFVSKVIGVPLAGLAARVMAGEKLKDLGFTKEVRVPFVAVKEAVFPFVKFPGADVALSPEMKSTGEVMGIDRDLGLAYLKSQVAAGSRLPSGGNIFLSIRDEDKATAVELARTLDALGYTIFATCGTSTALCEAGIKARALFRISRGRPNILDLIAEEAVGWIVNTSEPGAEAMTDSALMRSAAVRRGIPLTTTIDGMKAAIDGLADKADFGRYEVLSLQEYHRRI